jgi:hypothetical protein
MMNRCVIAVLQAQDELIVVGTREPRTKLEKAGKVNRHGCGSFVKITTISP